MDFVPFSGDLLEVVTPDTRFDVDVVLSVGVLVGPDVIPGRGLGGVRHTAGFVGLVAVGAVDDSIVVGGGGGFRRVATLQEDCEHEETDCDPEFHGIPPFGLPWLVVRWFV